MANQTTRFNINSAGNLVDEVGVPLPISPTGTSTNDSAGTGIVGEIASSLVAVGSAVSLTTATAANVTSLSLTAGDWDVRGLINFTAGSATITAGSGGITATTATVPTDGSEANDGVVCTTTTLKSSITLPPKRVSIAETTTIYMVASKTFSAGTVGAYGSLTARRVR